MAAPTPVVLQEYMDFEYEPVVLEAKDGKPAKVLLRGLFQEADKPNGNNRIYPRHLLEREINRLSSVIAERRMIGELDHPPGRVRPELKEASHVITKLEMRGNSVFGELEILNTARGKDLLALYEAGVRIGVSSRGTGGLKQLPNGTLEVDESLQLNTWDVVNEPSVAGAYVAESQQQNKIYAVRTDVSALTTLKKRIYTIF